MRLKIKEFKIYIDEIFLIIILLSIIWKSIGKYFENYFMCYLFIIFHELSHMFLASIFGIKMTKISICISGLNINLNGKNRQGMKWLIIFMAGPISNIILAILFRNIPMIYTINLALAIMNLIPVYPLDGYHILGLVLNMNKVKNTIKIQKTTQYIIIILIGFIGIYQLRFFYNPSIILVAFYVFLQSSNTRENYNSNLYQEYYKNITKFD